MTDEGRRRAASIAAAMLPAVLVACASNVILLPQEGGRPSAVVVKQGEKEIVLDRPYAAASAALFGPRGYESDPQEVDSLFGAALAAQPSRAATFTLYFVVGKDEFTEESKQIVDKIMSEIAKRPVPDILVIGHTDQVGSDQYNDALGRQRAEMVRAAIIRLGIPQSDIRAISRGKREPAVPTPDGVAEPRNRRVVIVVR